MLDTEKKFMKRNVPATVQPKPKKNATSVAAKATTLEWFGARLLL
jgi:hypothetical protein